MLARLRVSDAEWVNIFAIPVDTGEFLVFAEEATNRVLGVIEAPHI
jgi:hypothetical protein